MKTFTQRASYLLAASALRLSMYSNMAVAADNNQEVKVGFVMFLSGAASGPFGIPARNAAELLVDGINSVSYTHLTLPTTPYV